MVSNATTSNGLQEANALVKSIYHQITCADAPINNLSEIQLLIGENARDKNLLLHPTPEGNDNLSSTASEQSFNSSIGPSYVVSKKGPLLPPRPPKENHSITNLEDAAAMLTGTVSLAALCQRTEESVKSLENNGEGSFPTLPPLDGEISAVLDPTPRRSNGGANETITQLQGQHGINGINEQTNGFFDEDNNIGDFYQIKQQQRGHKKYTTPNKASDTSQQSKPRMQMFASEYARILSSSSKHNHTSVSSHKPRLPPSMGVSSKLKAKLSRSDHDVRGINGSSTTTLDDSSPPIATAAITDLIVTTGTDIPPRGYYRAFSLDLPEKNIGPTRKRSKRMFLNAKKEVNWDRAVQRPCVTAICVIYPDRNEFVPPGFSVVRLFGGSSATVKEMESNHESSSPANINPSSSGERVYLCYRRSREGNPITGILCLRPTRGDVIPEGYTVVERTPRNFVADMSAKTGDHPMFLAYRQRLENLECLRPLPLVLAVLHSRSDVAGRKEMNAYYCTGGTTVASDVGHLVSGKSPSVLLYSTICSSHTHVNNISHRCSTLWIGQPTIYSVHHQLKVGYH